MRPESTHFLKILEALVRGSSSRPHILGSVSIGVCDAEGSMWTRFAFGSTLEITRDCQDPSKSDAAMLVSGEDVQRLLDPQATLEMSPDVFGDKSLLLQFLARYLGYSSPIGLRAASPNRRSQRFGPRDP